MKKLLNNNFFRLVLVLLFLVVCAGVGAGYAYIKYESNPTEEATQYFRALVTEDYDKMYKLINVEDNAYVNKKIYADRMKKVRESLVIDSYEFSEPYKEDGKKMVDITCNDDTKETSQIIKIVFDEVRRGIRIIPDYKVNIDNMLVHNIEITVPAGDNLEISGDKITDNNATIKKGKDKDIYKIDSIIYGEYTIAATNDFCKSESKAEIIKPDFKLELMEKNYVANNKFGALIEKNADAMITQFYSNVRERKGNDKKLKAYFANDKKLHKKVEKLLEESKEVVYWPDTKNIDNYKLISMEMGKITHKSVYNGNNTYTATYDLTYKYVSSTDTELTSSYIYSIGGSCKTQIILLYTVKDDNVILTDISIKNKNSKNEETD